MKRIFLAVSLLALGGCVTVTPPVALGEGRYMISLNANDGMHGNGELVSETIQRANAFCATKGGHADVLNSQSSGVQMWTPQDTQVTFRCADGGTPAAAPAVSKP